MAQGLSCAGVARVLKGSSLEILVSSTDRVSDRPRGAGCCSECDGQILTAQNFRFGERDEGQGSKSTQVVKPDVVTWREQ